MKDKVLISFKKIMKNESGMAIIMVLSAVAILTLLLANFTYETEINKLKIYNGQDKLQARLNAEAGLKFALAKLKLYQEARNLIEKNKSLKSTFKPDVLESVVTQPFKFPIPKLKGMSQIQLGAIEEFTDSILLKGELQVSMSPVKGFLNPNQLVVPKVVEGDDRDSQQDDPPDDGEEADPPHVIIEKKLVAYLEERLQEEKEKNENFDLYFSTAEPELMVKELKYFVNPKGSLDDPLIGDIDALYSQKNVEAKFAPFTSLDELYLLEGWNDAMVDLIKDKLSVHEVGIIPINDINNEQLRILFPAITDEQLEEFFKYRDGDEELGIKPTKFQDPNDFKKLVVDQLAVTDSAGYDERIKEFEKANLKLGIAGKLFKVEIEGRFERSVYRIIAYIDIPVAPIPDPKKKKTNPNDPNKTTTTNPNAPNAPSTTSQEDPKKMKYPTQFMSPRVVEIILN